MSIRIMSDVWRTDLPTTEKMVLLVIADHANDDGSEAWPSQATIAKKASVSIRTVQRAVNNLVAEGYVWLDKHQGGSATCRDDRRPHRYTIVLSRLRGDSTTTRKSRGDSHDLDGATFTPDTGRLLRPMKHPIEPPKETPDDFDLFWKEYPIKVGKQAAKRAFEKAVKTATVKEIVMGAKRYANDPNRHPSYTAHASTWLNAGRWADDPLPAREVTPDEKRRAEVESARLKAEAERLETERYFQELEKQREKATPMPEYLKGMLRKL